MTELLPCPFCGSKFKMGQEPHDNHPVAGQFYIYHEYGPLGSEARKCRLDIRGHFESAEEAVKFWNGRALSSRTSNEAVVRVKPLEWEEASVPDHHAAEAVFGYYEVWKNDRGVFHCNPGMGAGERVLGTLDDAKSICQSDYEQRILSALVTGSDALAETPSQDVGEHRLSSLETKEN